MRHTADSCSFCLCFLFLCSFQGAEVEIPEEFQVAEATEFDNPEGLGKFTLVKARTEKPWGITPEQRVERVRQ